jgi:flagellar hook protein FlgE
MSLFDSLNTGVAGMNAQSRATGAISTNIANLNTVGYKKSDIAFSDVVADRAGTNKFNHGGVSTERIQRVDIQGQIQQTQVTTEAAISGAGFFVVKNSPNAEADFLFTRNGQFNEDNQGNLRNSAGFYLYGIPVGADGNATATGASLQSLEPVNVTSLNAAPIPTTRSTLAINLDASQQGINSQILNGGQSLPVTSQSIWDPVANTSIDTSAPAQFSRSQTVFDQNGTPRDLTFEYRKIIGPMAHITSGLPQLDRDAVMVDNTAGPTAGITNSDTFNLSAGANNLNVNFVNTAADLSLNQANTVQDMINVINRFRDGGGNKVFDAGLDDQGRLLVRASDPAATLDISGSSASVLGGTGLNIIPDPASGGFSYAPQASASGNSAAYPDQENFPELANTDNPNTRGWWEVRVLIPADPSVTSQTLPDPNNPNLTIPNPDYDPNSPLFGQQREFSKGLINFDSAGVLNVPRDAATNLPVAANIALNDLDFASATAGEEISVTVDIGRFQQFSGNFNVVFSEQNGAAPGTLTTVDITREGRVVANFTNGTQQDIYQIPLANFINPNGLNDISGTVFKATTDAGELELFDPGTNGAGLIMGNAIENSNVDLADEFATLIVTQRAYSANSRVVSTVDEMTEQLRSLKR